MEFEEFKLSKDLQETIRKLGFTIPTTIQEKSIPLILDGKDVVGESATGSGKTLAFGCGIVDKVKRGNGIQALILEPTRELAEQVKNTLKQLSKDKHLTIIPIYGGVSITNQIHDIPKADVVIATPGRLLDHIQRKTIDISKVTVLVLDEADRMFDMGFIRDVERIMEHCPREKRQTLFFSATITPNIKNLSRRHMHNPITVFAETYVDPSKLKQYFYNIPRNAKLSLIISLLQSEKAGLVMVFCNTRRSVDFLTRNLRVNKVNAIAIHGGLSQNKRTNTIGLFNNAKVNVLICTDVASRGLHIDNVSHVYNYELPANPKDYVHRIGRTARAGKEGKVINLLSEVDYGNYDNIIREYNNFIIEKLQAPELKQVFPVSERRPMGERQGSYQRRSNYSGNRDSNRNEGSRDRNRIDGNRNFPKRRSFSQSRR